MELFLRQRIEHEKKWINKAIDFKEEFSILANRILVSFYLRKTDVIGVDFFNIEYLDVLKHLPLLTPIVGGTMDLHNLETCSVVGLGEVCKLTYSADIDMRFRSANKLGTDVFIKGELSTMSVGRIGELTGLSIN